MEQTADAEMGKWMEVQLRGIIKVEKAVSSRRDESRQSEPFPAAEKPIMQRPCSDT